MVSDADAYERGVKISQTWLIPNFREGVQANPWFQLGYQMGLKHGASAAGMMSRAKSEFPAVAARLQASRPGAPDTFAIEDKDEMAGEDFAARLRSLITRFGFRPDEVSVSGRFGVGTISFKNQKGKATELVSKLRGAMKQMGVPEAAITAREVQYPADADGPAEHWGVVNVDFNKMPHAKSGKKDTMAVEDRFYFGKGRKERFASISMPRQSVTSGASGTWKKREVTVRGKKAWLVELHRGSVLVGYLNQHPDTRQFHAFDGNTDQQLGVGSESEMKRLVESL
jgi:hypothetical protein